MSSSCRGDSTWHRSVVHRSPSPGQRPCGVGPTLGENVVGWHIGGRVVLLVEELSACASRGAVRSSGGELMTLNQPRHRAPPVGEVEGGADAYSSPPMITTDACVDRGGVMQFV